MGMQPLRSAFFESCWLIIFHRPAFVFFGALRQILKPVPGNSEAFSGPIEKLAGCPPSGVPSGKNRDIDVPLLILLPRATVVGL
jgi:hypothetical protein